ncbi:hypothetical protein [Flavobacterium sp. N2820]|uniref:hypothetical protein n=1 Tax=Flavobacterium sp. N2820 TaxID=2986834 RepID=UPI00222504D2|nr:hypothetical protein [Flavobacterium sp. N2820]
MKKYFLITILLLSIQSFSQNLNKSKIDETLINYFKLDRENIFLHLNKSNYLTNETIWFKGYIIEKKESKLNFETTNVYVSLLDENGLEISNHLFYASNGIVLGQIKINESLPSGNYYIHVYTNYMNNFKENESTIQPLKIINISDKIVPTNSNETSDPSIKISYEGGKLLANTDNTVGVNIVDCFGNGLKISTIKVKNSKGEIVNSFATNNEGFGKFEILNANIENYTLEIEHNSKIILKTLDLPVTEGINLSAINYIDEEKIIITVKTNEESLKKFKNKPYSIIIQKNDQGNIVDFTLDATQKKFVINQSNLPEGINSIRLINSDLESIAERVIYNDVIPNKITLTTIKTKDSIKVSGKINNRIGNFSVSTLPIASTINKSNTIISNLVFKNYCSIENLNTDYYFENFNKRKKYELDLVLLHSKTNYKWNSMLTEIPKETYSFDIGINIEGKVNQKVGPKEKLRLFSVNNIDETTTLNDKNEFEFKNILAVDSSNFHFSLIKNDEKLQSLNIYSRIINNNRKFNKKSEIKKSFCITEKFVKNDFDTNFDFPRLENVTVLEDVQVIEVKKEKLEKEREYNNSMAKGYKINDSDVTSFRDVLSFIASHGYDVSQEAGTVAIRSRSIRSIMGSRSPAVFLDNGPVSDFSLLTNILLIDVDEIYINKHGYGMGGDGSNGSIRIYTKRTYGINQNRNNIKSKSLIIKGGFQPLLEFENPKYVSYSGESFQKHGTIDWIPNIYTDENGNFEFTIPHFNQEKIKLNIQGIDNFGQLYYNNFEIDVK